MELSDDVVDEEEVVDDEGEVLMMMEEDEEVEDDEGEMKLRSRLRYDEREVEDDEGLEVWEGGDSERWGKEELFEKESDEMNDCSECDEVRKAINNNINIYNII